MNTGAAQPVHGLSHAMQRPGTIVVHDGFFAGALVGGTSALAIAFALLALLPFAGGSPASSLGWVLVAISTVLAFAAARLWRRRLLLGSDDVVRRGLLGDTMLRLDEVVALRVTSYRVDHRGREAVAVSFKARDGRTIRATVQPHSLGRASPALEWFERFAQSLSVRLEDELRRVGRVEWVSGVTITPSSLVAGETELPFHDIVQARPTGVYYLVTDSAGREIHASNEELNYLPGRFLFERLYQTPR